MPRTRPSALDFSFDIDSMEVDSDTASTSARAGPSRAGGFTAPVRGEVSRGSSVASSTSSLGKRKATDEEGEREKKRPKGDKYWPQGSIRREDETLVVEGEDPYHENEDEDGASSEPQDKPIRELFEFAIFDPHHGNEYITLDALELNDGVDRNFEAVGRVRAHLMSEDDGMEEDLYGEDGDEDETGDVERAAQKGGKGKGRDIGERAAEERGRKAEKAKPEMIRLSSILRYAVDYTQESEPFYIETQYAWYILRTPDKHYTEYYKYFQGPRRITQLVISGALKRPKEGYSDFLKRFTSRVDIFGHTYTEEDLFKSVDELRAISSGEADFHVIQKAPFVKYILQHGQSNGLDTSRRTFRLGNKNLPTIAKVLGNPDLAVLKPEYQNSTHVTPRIAQLAQGLFREEIVVIGPPPPSINKAQAEARKARDFEKLEVLMERVHRKKHIEHDKKYRIDLINDFYSTVKIDGVTYTIGDVVLMPKAIPIEKKIKTTKDDRVDQLFWYARIQYFQIGSQDVHVQWFYHASQTIMDEVSHPKELFLSHDCGDESLQKIVGKVNVAYFAEPELLKPDEYFCKFYYNQEFGSFEAIPQQQFQMLTDLQLAGNCGSCSVRANLNHMREPYLLKKDGKEFGLAFAGKCLHLNDFVTYRGDSVSNIGYVVGIIVNKKKHIPSEVLVRKVGRISDLMSIAPGNVMKDERHLYLTNEQAKFPVHDFVDLIYASCYSSLQQLDCPLEDWLNLSQKHFYIRYVFPRLNVKSWKSRQKLHHTGFDYCAECSKERLRGRHQLQDFLEVMKDQPLRTLDLFGGIGAFSGGLSQGSGCMEVTHAIEISPSAARTFRKNSPHTVVYNQCANLMLRYMIKSREGHAVDQLYQIDDRTEIPRLPRPTDIDVIVAGFPCQSHSTLNMFKSSDDLKSNLILTTLSFVDFCRPKYAYFENVPGFVRFGLHADKANQYGVKGEVPKGGLKLVVRAMIDMGYQLRFANMQAVHYGTPQGRSRFFLIAAKAGYPLPAFPQPTHHHPKLKDQTIKYKNALDDPETEIKINPIRSTPGTALHPHVSIWDAIGDLPAFDWKHPNPNSETPTKKEERRIRREIDKIPVLECKKSERWCGFSGRIGYKSEPKSTFQYNARLQETTNIQQYTKCIVPPKVSRTLAIPLRAGADYRDLPPSEHDWYMRYATGASARHGYRKGVYGRLDQHAIFGTTVTNVDPTAKQCQVLHPTQHRMVTVRELARSQGLPDSFVFVAIKDSVVTMHRQIGNAVPIPVGHALGRELRRSLFTRWKSQREEAIVIEDDESDIVSEGGQQSLPPPSDGFDDDPDDMYA